MDGENVVMGRVLEGMGAVGAAAAVPTFKPSENSRVWNQVAAFVGDERAAKARTAWDKPTQAIAITSCGRL